MKNILKKLIRHKSPAKNIIWGIRIQERVKTRWSLLAGMMRLPTNRLVTYALQDWIQQNADILTDDKARNKLADCITRLYLSNKLN